MRCPNGPKDHTRDVDTVEQFDPSHGAGSAGRGGERGLAGDIGEIEKVHVPEVTCQGLGLVPSSERM